MTNVTTASAGSARGARRLSPPGAARRGRVLRLLRLLAGCLLAWCVVAWGAARLLIVRAELPQADALVVLSGSSAYVERTRWAARLWSEGRAPKIVLTDDGLRGGWSSAEQRNPFFVERAAAELSRAGVPPARIEVLPETVAGTHDEAVLLRRYAEARGLRSILLVTSAYHSRRTLWTMRTVFAGSGVKIGLDAPPPGEQTPPPVTWWLHRAGWPAVGGEYAKLLYYYLRFR